MDSVPMGEVIIGNQKLSYDIGDWFEIMLFFCFNDFAEY